ncbi:hypothetical protein M758_11G160200 [Ceratodon purpureus]|nr:hypothetical protein M758_11G160200 [Ceratodon purpureus]
MGSEAMESSDERRARLRALRAAQELAAQPTHIDLAPSNATANVNGNGSGNGNGQHLAPQADQDGTENADGEMRFRNYFPRDSDLQKAKHPPPVIPRFEDPVTVEPLQVTGAEDPIVSIAPKKPNWDLRRDVAKKLEKLEKRTHRAIVELMNEEEKRRQAEAANNMEED